MYRKLEQALALLDHSLIAPAESRILYIGQAEQLIMEYIEEGYRMNQEETTIGD